MSTSKKTIKASQPDKNQTASDYKNIAEVNEILIKAFTILDKYADLTSGEPTQKGINFDNMLDNSKYSEVKMFEQLIHVIKWKSEEIAEREEETEINETDYYLTQIFEQTNAYFCVCD